MTTMIDTIRTNGGFTYDPELDQIIEVGRTSGFAVAVPGTEHVVGTADIDEEAFVEAVSKIVTEYADHIHRGAFLGGWYSSDREVYVVELTEIVQDPTWAKFLGHIRHQEAIFDLATGEAIPTGGHGDSVVAA